jgi:dTDP-4-amino-4,6-dideoxygalactose transaminase
MTASPAPGRTDLAPIGGFFERHSPGAAGGASLVDAWTEGRPYGAFGNARSAFAALAEAFPKATVWLPAFLCHDLVQPAYAERIRFYPVLEGFEPDLDTVTAAAETGDLVLIAAYFGLPVGAKARQALQRRPDLHVVEDCAQALDPGPHAGASWRLFSPRKLLGVADGGLLVARDAAAILPQPTAAADSDALWAAPSLRADDPLGRRNAEWHAANQAKEAGMAVSSEAMTALSAEILSRTPRHSLSTPRMANWRALDRRLGAWSALPSAPAAPPLGYVLHLPADQRDRVLSGLHAERIFAAVHWPRIAGPAEDFPREAQWARELITLPCDHRYGPAEMARIADTVEALLA